MPHHTFDGLDGRFRGHLKGTSWCLCIGAGVSADILPPWPDLTREVLAQSMGVPIDEQVFSDILANTGWGFDALLQAALNAWLASGKKLDEFPALIERVLYRALLNDAATVALERQVIAAFTSPHLLTKDEFPKVLKFIKGKASSAHALGELLLQAQDARCGPHAVITLNYDTILETVLRLLQIDRHRVKVGRHEFPPSTFWRVVGPAAGHDEATPIIHIHGCVTPRTPRRRHRAPHDTRDAIVGPETSYSRLAGNPSAWAQTSFMHYSNSDSMVLIGQSLSDPNVRRWLAWSTAVRTSESTRRAGKPVEVLPHLWFRRKPRKLVEAQFYENAIPHLGLRVVWLDSWKQTADVLRNLLAIGP